MLTKQFYCLMLILLISNFMFISVNAQDDGQPNGWTIFDGDDATPLDGVITSLTIAQDNTLWVGTQHGLLHYDDQTWTTYTQNDGLRSNHVQAVSIAPDGTVWALLINGVAYFDGQTWISHSQKDGLNTTDYFYRTIVHTPDGTVWISSNDGIHRYDGHSWELIRPRSGTPKLAVAPDGTLWVGGFEGYCLRSWVDYFDGETWIEFTQEDGLVQGCIWSLTVAQDGGVWIAHWGVEGEVAKEEESGLIHFDGENWTQYTREDHPSLESANDVSVTSDNIIWVATIEGVLQFDGETWTQFTTEEGLADNATFVIAVAPDSTVWIGTANGLSRYIPPLD